MTNIIKAILVSSAMLAMLACSGQQAREPVSPTPVQQPPPAETTPVAEPAQPTVDELDVPGSLLSQRVIYFDFDKADIRPEFREVLRAHAQYIASHSSARVTLEGHADERGTREYNLGLGEQRGENAAARLAAMGAGGGQVSVVSYGEERPVATCHDESCWSKNRRVEIIYTAR